MRKEIGAKLSPRLPKLRAENPYGIGRFLLFLSAVTMIRWLAIMLTPVPVTPDEGQYALYARNLSWVYYSKPPGLPFLIHLGELLFGQTRIGLRFFSPILHAGAALFLYKIADDLYKNPKISFYAGLIYLFSTGVIFASGLATSDTPLLFGYAMAMYGFFRFITFGAFLPSVLICGFGLAFAFYAKYAAIYFLISAFGSLAFIRAEKRKRVFQFLLAVSVLVVLFLAPHLIALVKQGFVTVKHLAENADISRPLFSLLAPTEFIGGQFGAFHPVFFPLLIYVIYRVCRGDFSENEKISALFAVAPLALVTAQAFFNRAHANWAAPAYLAGSLLCSYAIMNLNLRKILVAGGWVSGGAFALFPVLCAIPFYFSLYTPSAFDPARRFRHMDIFAEIIEENMIAEEVNFLISDRKNGALVAYFADSDKIKDRFYAADIDGKPSNHFELARPITVKNAKNQIFIYAVFSHYDIPDPDPKILRAFGKVSKPAIFAILTHSDRKAYMILRELSDFQGFKP